MDEIFPLYEDRDLLVISKPSGISSTVGPGNPFEGTVAGWVYKYIGEHITQVGQEERWGIVHRLDKETSGVMVTAKTIKMYESLINQFRNQQVEKRYSVLVWGNVENKLRKKIETTYKQQDKKPSLFEIKAPIGRHPKGISKFIVTPDGKQAVTKFKLEKIIIHPSLEDLSLLHAYPKTGRTHQIRVHLKALGFPVFGDKTYETKKQHKLSEKFIQRQFLHAQMIGITTLQGDKKKIEAPIPKDLQQVLLRLEEKV